MRTEHNWRDTEEWQCIGPYMRDLANRLGLRDWTLYLTHVTPNDDDAHAAVHPIEGRRHAEVFLCADWRKLEPNEKRAALVHGLVHCHGVPFYDLVRLDLPKHLGQQSYDLFYAAFRRTVEYEVDALTDVLAPLMPPCPYPPEPEPIDGWSI
jgi:hypothetical protein